MYNNTKPAAKIFFFVGSFLASSAVRVGELRELFEVGDLGEVYLLGE